MKIESAKSIENSVETDSNVEEALTITDEFFNFASYNSHVKYRLGSKDMRLGFIDCSGLLSYFAYTKGLLTWNQATNRYNSYSLYSLGTKKKFADINKGDMIFFNNSSGGPNHIGVYVSHTDTHITLVDASFSYGISKREIPYYYNGRNYIYNGIDRYTLQFSANLFTELEPIDPYHGFKKQMMTKTHYVLYNPNNKPSEFIADITTYVIPEIDDPNNINCGGSSCKTTANGTVLNDTLAGKIGSCPMQYPIGTKLFIEGHGTIICVDRGGLIVMKGDVNTRGNESGMNRIDVFGGVGTSKIGLSKSTRSVTVL